MPTNSPGMYSYIQHKSHHDAWRALLLVVILAVLALIGWLFVVVFGTTTGPAAPVTPSTSVTAQKQAVMERLRSVDVRPLTRQEAVNMINFVSRGGATYTTTEREMITKVLRKQ